MQRLHEAQRYQEERTVVFGDGKMRLRDEPIGGRVEDSTNEGELVGYSEQIIGRINDMAPGIPN